MKSLHVVFMVLLLVALLSCAPERKNKLEGVWELVSAKYTTPDSTYESTPANWKQMKLITKSHFAFVGEKPNRPHLKGWGTDSERLAAADEFFAGGGTYTLEGDTCTEHIEYFLTPNYVPVSIPFKCQVEGDQWIQTGKLPTKSLGIADYDMELVEVYKRIE